MDYNFSTGFIVVIFINGGSQLSAFIDEERWLKHFKYEKVADINKGQEVILSTSKISFIQDNYTDKYGRKCVKIHLDGGTEFLFFGTMKEFNNSISQKSF